MTKSEARGSALLSALFIMTLVAIVATGMSVRLQSDIVRTSLIIDTDRLMVASDAVLFWAMDLLENRKERFSVAGSDGVVAQFPTRLSGLCPGITIEGRLIDLQARFNLNNLLDNKYRAIFWRLLTIQLPGVPANTRQTMALALIDWQSLYDPERGLTALDNYYLSLSPPYQAAHQALHSISELRLVSGVSQALMRTLSPEISALAGTSLPININTASAKMLQALGFKENAVNELLQKRGKTGISKLQTVEPLFRKNNISTALITLQSAWFMSVAKVRLGDREVVRFVIYERALDRKRGVTARVVSAGFNTL
ncbi:general secretion pathway protein GspK [Legionella geestiana]|uniref:type II secretion system minor pseudopilin GspK n=1 Tax=Legionella geestiana TaxID=45065 RepID=UPI0010929988|nr:type II secretion system minor pseudopilin GspK [Legionella geestiana]QDQ40992.1 general secretion pathway protein GspK [Legionella geestiana]